MTGEISNSNQSTDYSEKQVRIIEATQLLIASKGYEGTSVRDIAQEAGVNIAMISYYFGSKEKLLAALFSYRMGSSLPMLEHLIADKDLSHLEKVDIMIENYVEKLTENRQFYKILIQEQIVRTLPEVNSLIEGMKERNRNMVKTLITKGQRDRIFSKKIDIPLMMTTLIGTIYQALNTQEIYRRLHKLEKLSEPDLLSHLKHKLKIHLKLVFKATLLHEA